MMHAFQNMYFIFCLGSCWISVGIWIDCKESDIHGEKSRKVTKTCSGTLEPSSGIKEPTESKRSVLKHLAAISWFVNKKDSIFLGVSTRYWMAKKILNVESA